MSNPKTRYEFDLKYPVLEMGFLFEAFTFAMSRATESRQVLNAIEAATLEYIRQRDFIGSHKQSDDVSATIFTQDEINSVRLACLRTVSDVFSRIEARSP